MQNNGMPQNTDASHARGAPLQLMRTATSHRIPRDHHFPADDSHAPSLLQAAGVSAATNEPLSDQPRDPSPGLPLANVTTTAARSRYCATTMNNRGRLADQTPLKFLGWGPSTPIMITLVGDTGLIVVRRYGPDALTRQGFLHLPARVRRACTLYGGDRLLLLARPMDQLLLAYTPRAVETMTAAFHSTITATLEFL